jgi:hypothetical protein
LIGHDASDLTTPTARLRLHSLTVHPATGTPQV